MGIEPELRQASDELLESLSRLYTLEAEKRATEPGSERFVALSREVESLAADVLGWSREQRRLATRSVRLASLGELETARPISEIPAPAEEIAAEAAVTAERVREPHVILGEWRDAERRLTAAAPGTAEHRATQDEVERLRAEYRHSFETRLGR